MDQDALVEDEEPSFEDISNKNPAIVTHSFTAAIEFLGSYGWFCVFGAIVLWYLNSVFRRKYEIWKRQQEDAQAHKTDSAEALERQERLMAARARLQQQYDSVAAQHAEEQKKKEEEMRKQKIEDWESYLRGGTSKQSRDRAQAFGNNGGMMNSGSGGGSCRWTPSSRRQGRS